MLYRFPSDAVRKNFLLTESSSNSPSKKIFLICCVMPGRSTANSLAICSCVNQTVSSTNRTSTEILWSAVLNNIKLEFSGLVSFIFVCSFTTRIYERFVKESDRTQRIQRDCPFLHIVVTYRFYSLILLRGACLRSPSFHCKSLLRDFGEVGRSNL